MYYSGTFMAGLKQKIKAPSTGTSCLPEESQTQDAHQKTKHQCFLPFSVVHCDNSFYLLVKRKHQYLI